MVGRSLTTRHAWFFAVLELLVPRAKRLPDFASQGAFFFCEAVKYDEAAVGKHLRADGVADHLKALSAEWLALPSSTLCRPRPRCAEWPRRAGSRPGR